MNTVGCAISPLITNLTPCEKPLQDFGFPSLPGPLSCPLSAPFRLIFIFRKMDAHPEAVQAALRSKMAKRTQQN